ncbi:MAG: hypothetical protein EOP85_08685, partial [Verrucomicrobiaceae bacterium]
VWGGKTGNVLGFTNLPSKLGKLAANFRLADFNAGSTVNYEVLVDGIIRGSGTFTWSENNSNYIGVDVRDAALVTLDNLRIATDFVLPVVYPPTADAFETSRLTGTPNTRFHWNVTEGTLGDPVTITIKNSIGTVLHTSNTLAGFADVDTGSSTDFILTAANSIGESERETSLEEEDALSNAIRADAPLAWYRFNEPFASPLIVDSTPGPVPHNASPVTSTPTGFEGPRDGVANFTGNGSILTTLTLDPTTTVAGHTVEAFVLRHPLSPVNAAIVSQNDGTGLGRSHLAVDTDGTIQTFLAGGALQRKDADVKLAASNWAHVVMVVDKSLPEIRWYLDGVQIGSSSDGTNPDGTTFDPAFTLESATGAWRIGVQKLANLNYWAGDMDEVVIYDKILSPARITAHKDAWLASASGLLSLNASNTTITEGGSTTLTITGGADVDSVSVSPGGTVSLVNGVATLQVSPTVTTTYTISFTGVSGVQTLTVTISVEPSQPQPTVPPVITSGVLEAGGFRIRFTGIPSTTYRVRGSLDLGSFAVDHGTVATDGTGLGEVLVPVVSGEKAHFYRIEEIPAP